MTRNQNEVKDLVFHEDEVGCIPCKRSSRHDGTQTIVCWPNIKT